MDLEQKWLNPIADINYENYEQGLIKSYQLGFQDKEWHSQNKDNFCNSLKSYPELLPSFVNSFDESLLPNNYLGFYPDEFIRYGYLEKINLIIENNIASFWVVRIPAGFQLYHSSRSLGLNHSDFPLSGYSNRLKNDENKTNIKNGCPNSEFLGHAPSDIMQRVCTYVSYYSTPYVTQQYLKKTNYMGNQINYAYGIDQNSPNTKYNDRVRTQSDEYNYGVTAYKLKSDTYFVILGLDDFLTDRPDLGRENMKTFKRAMIYLSADIRQNLNVPEEAFQNFINIIDSVTGIGSIQDNINMITKDYGTRNFENNIRSWLKQNADFYNKYKTNTAGYIKNVAYGINNNITDLRQYKGLRFSTYEHDRPVMNMIGWLFSSFSNKENVSVQGFVSSSMYVATKNRSELKDYPFERNGLFYYVPYGVFHSEVGIFYAPDVLTRDKNNKFDLDYSINYEGITQELRKYKTTNITRETSRGIQGFHQGHLLEHSAWVSILSGELSSEIGNKDKYLIAGYFHDIGKSGDCVQTETYKGLDLHSPSTSACSFVRSNSGEIVGMKYFDIPDHPEKGYEFMKGYRIYKKYTLSGINSDEEYNKKAIPVYFEDWERMFDHLKVADQDRKLIRIAIGAHWYYGYYVDKILSTTPALGRDLINEFLRKIEIFYNDEFIQDNNFLDVIKFVLVISLADIIGSKFSPDLKSASLADDQKATLINFLPNIKQGNYLNPNDATPAINQLINYALALQTQDRPKQKIINDVRNNFDNFLGSVIEALQGFKFKKENNYSLLWNLINSYIGIDDIKRAYPYQFPTIIIFDLDQTLFRIQFNPNSLSTYYIYEDTYKVISEVQKVRNDKFPSHPTYIGIISRHYSPKSLRNLLLSKEYQGKENPLYYMNFDFIISRYTGSDRELIENMRNIPRFFEYNGVPSDGFFMNTRENSYREIKDNDPNFPNLTENSKYGHFNFLKNISGIGYDRMLAFDDDKRYFSSVGLGQAKDVTVAGVLSSEDVNKQGITESLFRQGVAYYVFEQLSR